MSDVFTDIFKECLKQVNDREYCRGVVEAVMELAETRCVAYRRGRVGYTLYLPRNDRPLIRVAVDYKEKRGVIVALAGSGYIVFLMYRRNGGKFYPIHAELMNTEIAAMTNPKPLGGVVSLENMLLI